MNSVVERIDKLDRWVLAREGQRTMVLQSITDTEEQIDKVEVEWDEIEKAVFILRRLGEIKRKTTTERVESLVTFGLKTVLMEDIRLKVLQKESGNQVVSQFFIEYGDGNQKYEVDLMDGEGGGVVKLCEFLLKLLVVLMLKPQLRRFVVCDENFAMVSRGNIGRLCELLRELSSRMDFQFFMVTHQIELEAAADKLYTVEKPTTESKLIKG